MAADTSAPAPAPNAPLAGYQQQQHLSEKFCTQGPIHSKVGQDPVDSYASRLACADTCSEDARCTFFLWKGCAPGVCKARYHCAWWETASACDNVRDYNDGDSAVIFKKVNSTPAPTFAPTPPTPAPGPTSGKSSALRRKQPAQFSPLLDKK